MLHIANRPRVVKHILDNGLTILFCSMPKTYKVSAQLWYHVGSKDERDGQRGLAHFLEHMLFKGTGHLSESDINVISHKLSGYCNAFTSYDSTMYLFDVPHQHWYEVLPLLADCMSNARLDEQHLNSEVKAVIQELKMYKDDYTNYLFEELISAIFAEHPYHYPIIGFKQDLWSLNRDSLMHFYKTHYVPNNATLVLAGDFEIDEALDRVEKSFGSIATSETYKKTKSFWQEDIISKSITLYRPVENPVLICTWVIPGLKDRCEYIATALSWVLGQGKGSRLYKLLVDDLQLATDIQIFVHNFFEYGLFSVEVQLKDVADTERIKHCIHAEMERLSGQGWTAKEALRARKKMEADYLSLFENPQKLGMAIGETFLATGDEQHVFNFMNIADHQAWEPYQAFIARYLRVSVMHTGLLLPIPEQEQHRMDLLQQESDALDTQILSQKTRTSDVEKPRYADLVYAQPATVCTFPTGSSHLFDNGMTVLHYEHAMVPMIEISLDFKAKHYYDPIDKQGLGLCLSYFMMEGTSRYSAHDFALELESYGMSMQIDPGCISLTVLKDDLQKGFEFLKEVVLHALLPAEALEKIKTQMVTDLDAYWDEPMEFSNQLMREALYPQHPYSKNILGTHETIAAITHRDVVEWYAKTIVPVGATLVIVGDTHGYDVVSFAHQYFGSWQGSALTIDFPVLPVVEQELIQYPIKRDQTVLCFAGRSVARMDKDFDALLIFDQIFSGGLLNSMNSRLFMLREESGLFYTIKGSLIASADEQPGMVFIKTLVSNDRLFETVQKIQETVETAPTSVQDDEFEQAKNIISNVLIENFSTNQQIAASLLFLKRYGLPADYFETRLAAFNAITREDMIGVVKKYLVNAGLVCIQVGRLEDDN